MIEAISAVVSSWATGMLLYGLITGEVHNPFYGGIAGITLVLSIYWIAIAIRGLK